MHSAPHLSNLQILNQGVNLVFTKDKESLRRQISSFWCNGRFKWRIKAPV